jgi:hypothetical protein
MNLDSSWVIGLAASLQQGAIAGRDFQFTYGPASQFVASLGAWLNVDRSAYPTLPLIVLCFWLYSIGLLALIVLVLKDLDWKAILLICGAGAVLNLFSEPTSFRNLSVLLCGVVFYRSAAAQSNSRRFLLALSSGLLAFWAQLTSLDLGLYAIAVIVGVSVGMALLAWESAKCYVAAGVVAIATLTAGNIFLSVVFGCLRIGMEITPGYSSINVVFACTSTAALMPRGSMPNRNSCGWFAQCCCIGYSVSG